MVTYKERVRVKHKLLTPIGVPNFANTCSVRGSIICYYGWWEKFLNPVFGQEAKGWHV